MGSTQPRLVPACEASLWPFASDAGAGAEVVSSGRVVVSSVNVLRPLYQHLEKLSASSRQSCRGGHAGPENKHVFERWQAIC